VGALFRTILTLQFLSLDVPPNILQISGWLHGEEFHLLNSGRAVFFPTTGVDMFRFLKGTLSPQRGNKGKARRTRLKHWKGLVVLLKLRCMMICEYLMIWGVPKNI